MDVIKVDHGASLIPTQAFGLARFCLLVAHDNPPSKITELVGGTH